MIRTASLFSLLTSDCGTRPPTARSGMPLNRTRHNHVMNATDEWLATVCLTRFGLRNRIRGHNSSFSVHWRKLCP